MGPTVTLTGAPAIAVLLLLAVCWSVPFAIGTHYAARWLIDRHLDKVKARYKARFGEDFDPDGWKAS